MACNIISLEYQQTNDKLRTNVNYSISTLLGLPLNIISINVTLYLFYDSTATITVTTVIGSAVTIIGSVTTGFLQT